MAQRVKHLPTMWETWVRSLGREDPLEEGMATHSSILAWRILRTEEPGGLKSMAPVPKAGAADANTRLPRVPRPRGWLLLDL